MDNIDIDDIWRNVKRHRSWIIITILAIFGIAMVMIPRSSGSSSAMMTSVTSTPHTRMSTTVTVYCPAGFIHHDTAQCQPCTAGHYCDHTMIPQICPIGHYCPIASQAAIPCGALQTTSDEGAAHEVQCRCEFGFYRVTDPKKPCQQCPTGTFCSDGQRMYSCPQSLTSSKGATSEKGCHCAEGLQLLNGQCQSCPAGSLCKDGTIVPCPINHYCPLKATAAIACPNAHHVSPEGSSDATSCTCGTATYNDGDKCTPCEAGAWCHNGVKQSCGDRGTSAAGSTKPTDCHCDPSSLAVDIKTADGTTITECRQCPSGFTCDGTSVSVGCPANHYCPIVPAGVKAPAPTACPPDRPKSPMGSTELTQCRSLVDCDDGMVKSAATCINCPRGSYCRNNVQEKCKVGWYCPEGSALPTLCVRPGLGEAWPSPSAGMSEDGKTDPCWEKQISASATPVMTPWYKTPLNDVVDDGTGWRDDKEDGPKLTKNAAVIRCDNMHPMGDGVSLAQFKYWTVLEQAMCSRRHWILPNWRKRYDAPDFLPWEALWEWKNFSRGLQEQWGIAAVIPRRLENEHMPGSNWQCTTEPGAMPQAGTSIMHGDWPSLDKAHYADGNVIAFKYLRPSSSLMTAINEVRRAWHGGYTCLHLRTESDWVQWFNGPSRQTLPEQVQRFQSSYDLAFGNGTSSYKATLTRPLDDPVIHARLFASKRIYITGEHGRDAFDEITRLFKPMYPEGVFSKATIGLDAKYSWDKRAFSNIESAVIDREICIGADQFVGNAFSGWSISVYGRRIYSEKYASMGSWLANGQYNWMTNPLEKGEAISGPLNPYCPNAFLTCPHFTGG